MQEQKENDLKHLAIIMDGNRRWATEHGLPKLIGHTEGGKNLKRVIKAVHERGIQYLTVWALSTENLSNRSADELAHLFSLFEKLVDYLDDLKKNNIRVTIIGDVTKLPASTQKKLIQIESETKNNTGLVLALAVNYGGRDEIIRAVRKIIEANISPDEVTEETLPQFLDTDDMPDPDLIIRTAGDQRLSGLLPWQSTYAELYFTKTKWPDFGERDLDDAIGWFFDQKRNKGK